MGISFLFGVQGAPGKAAGKLQNIFCVFCNFVCVLAGFPLVSDGPMERDLCNLTNRKVSYGSVLIPRV